MATAGSTRSVSTRAREGGYARLADAASYWLILTATYIAFGFLFCYSAKERLIGDSATVPTGLAKGFQGSAIASFPVTNTSWLLLGRVEAVVFLGVVASLLTGGFFPSRRKPVLLSAMGAAMFAFGLMAFAENMTAQFSTVSELFGYFSGTAVLIVLVLLTPPYRRSIWLSSLGGRGAGQ